MPVVTKEEQEKLDEIAQIVATMPPEARELAFEFLLDRAFPERRAGASRGESAGVSAIDVEAESESDYEAQLARLAAEVDVPPERIGELLSLDDEGIHVITQNLGAVQEAERNRRVTLLVLWARRLLSRDVYVPRSDIVDQLQALKIPITNLTTNLNSEKCVNSVSLRGVRMFQLVGNWRDRIRQVVSDILGVASTPD